jgi:uncharacterized protein (TIGR02466 family)
MEEFSKVLPSNAVVSGLFPIPVYKKNIGRELNAGEIKYSDINSWQTQQGSDNLRATSTSVLDIPAFFGVKTFIQSCINDYVKEILSPTTNTQLYITQSWINFNRYGDKHHQHFHSNSILSGSFYLNVCAKDMIFYVSPIKHHIHITKNPNWWNMSRIGVSVTQGDAIIFPSYLEHGVEHQSQEDHTRVSIAFNTWFKGEIGDEVGLTRLTNKV